MEMCYDGALVMPSSYVAMDEEEMSYVEGGWKVTITKPLLVAGVVTVAGFAARKWTLFKISKFLKANGKAIFKYILECTNPTISAISAILASFVAAATIAAATIAGYVWITGKSVTIGW